MVPRAFGDTSGKTWSRTSPRPEPTPPEADFATSSEAGAFAGEAAEVASSLSLVGFKVSGAGGGMVGCRICGAAGAADFAVWEIADSGSGFVFGFDESTGSAGFETAL